MPTPLVTGLQVISVAGRDSMLLNLSDAYGPFFTRNIVIVTDNAGHTGVGEVPGGEKIRQTLEDARELLLGRPIGDHLRILQQATAKFADRDVGGRGLKTFDLRNSIRSRPRCIAWCSSTPRPTSRPGRSHHRSRFLH